MMVSLRSSLVAVACLGLAAITAACTGDKSTPAAPSCSFSIAQPTTTFGPEGGTGTATVTAASGCAWTSTSSAAFLTISQGATGSGNGSVTFAVAVNTGAERTATLAIAGTSLTITQRAAATPTTTGTLAAPSAKSPIGGAFVDPGTPTLVVNNAASTGSVGTVTYRFELSDLATFPADAARTFSQDGVAQGSGTTSWVVNHDLGPNIVWYWHALATNGTLTTAYSATETFTTAGACTFTLSSTSATATAAGGTGTLTVTTTSACAWTAVSNASFITVTAGASGTGNGTVTYSVAANTGAARTGTLTVAGQTVTITQDAAGSCVYTLSATSATVSGGGATSNVTVTTDGTCAWTAVSNASFISVTAGSSRTGSGTVTFAVTANPGASTRTGTLTIAGQTFTVTQNPAVGLVASFQMFDPASQSGATTDCRFRSATASPSTCTLQSTSFTLGANTIVSYAWTVQYTYGTIKTISGSSSTLAITDTCGGTTSTADGVAQPLSVTLTVTDNLGATATATAGVGSQPALQVRLYTCGS